MYVTGYTADYVYDTNDWTCLGRVFARYDHWSTGNRKATYVAKLPYDKDLKSTITPVSFDIAGDYLFAVNGVDAAVTVFNLKNGRLVGEMKPDSTVGNVSGWVDMTDAITAYRRANGEYVVLVEEDARGKNIVYRWTPPNSPALAP